MKQPPIIVSEITMYSPVSKRVSGVLYFSISSSISLFILVLISFFLTWQIRGYLTIADVNHEFSTNFVFHPCTSTQSGVCSYPSASIDLRRRPYSSASASSSMLSPNLPYSIDLRFRVPDSESTRNAGMFMVKFALENSSGKILSSCETSTSIPYRSNLIRTIRRVLFWPLMILDYLQEYHKIHVRCPDPLIFDSNRGDEMPPTNLRIEIQNSQIQLVNDGRVQLTGNLRGLQYYLYWWPLISTIVLFFTIFWISTSIGFVFWLIRSVKKSSSTEEKKEDNPTPPPEVPTSQKKKDDEKRKIEEDALDANDDDWELSPAWKNFDDHSRKDQENRPSSMLRRMYGEENGHVVQRRSGIEKALLDDLDDSNLGNN